MSVNAEGSLSKSMTLWLVCAKSFSFPLGVSQQNCLGMQPRLSEGQQPTEPLSTPIH